MGQVTSAEHTQAQDLHDNTTGPTRKSLPVSRTQQSSKLWPHLLNKGGGSKFWQQLQRSI